MKNEKDRNNYKRNNDIPSSDSNEDSDILDEQIQYNIDGENNVEKKHKNKKMYQKVSNNKNENFDNYNHNKNNFYKNNFNEKNYYDNYNNNKYYYDNNSNNHNNNNHNKYHNRQYKNSNYYTDSFKVVNKKYHDKNNYKTKEIFIDDYQGDIEYSSSCKHIEKKSDPMNKFQEKEKNDNKNKIFQQQNHVNFENFKFQSGSSTIPDPSEENSYLANSFVLDKKPAPTEDELEQEVFAESANAASEFSWGFIFWSWMNFSAKNALSGGNGKNYWLSKKNVEHDYWEAVFSTIQKIDVIDIHWRLPPSKFRVFFKLDDNADFIPVTDLYNKDSYISKEGQISNKGAISEYNAIVFKQPIFAKRIRITLNHPIKKQSFSIFYVKFYQKKTTMLIKNQLLDLNNNYCFYVNTDKPRPNVIIEATPCIPAISMATNNELWIYYNDNSIHHYISKLCIGFNQAFQLVLSPCSEFKPAYTFQFNGDGSLYFVGYQDKCITIDDASYSSINFITPTTEVIITSEADSQTYKKENVKLDGENIWMSAPGQEKVTLQFLFGKILDGELKGQFENKKIDTLKIEWVKEPKKFMVYTWKPGFSWTLYRTYESFKSKKSEINFIGVEMAAFMLKLEEFHTYDELGGLGAYAIQKVYIGYNALQIKMIDCNSKINKFKMFDFELQNYIKLPEMSDYKNTLKKISNAFENSVSNYQNLNRRQDYIPKAKDKANNAIKSFNSSKLSLNNNMVKKLKDFQTFSLKVVNNFNFKTILIRKEEKQFLMSISKQKSGNFKIGTKGLTAKDCVQIRQLRPNALSGFYYIQPECAKKRIRTFCDFTIYGLAVDILIFNNYSSQPNPDLSYLNIRSRKDILYQCASLGLYPIQIYNENFVSRIDQLLKAKGYDMSKKQVVPLGWDYTCKNNNCANIYNSLNEKSSSPIMTFFDPDKPKEQVKQGPMAGLGHSDKPTMISFEPSEQIISAIICSTNSFEKDKADSEAITISCEMNVSNNGNIFLENKSTKVVCPSSCHLSQTPIYGTNIYHASSSICKAAIHSNIISTKGGKIVVRVLDNQSNYTKSVLNGISSLDYSMNDGQKSFNIKKYEKECPISLLKEVSEDEKMSFIELKNSNAFENELIEKIKMNYQKNGELINNYAYNLNSENQFSTQDASNSLASAVNGVNNLVSNLSNPNNLNNLAKISSSSGSLPSPIDPKVGFASGMQPNILSPNNLINSNAGTPGGPSSSPTDPTRAPSELGYGQLPLSGSGGAPNILGHNIPGATQSIGLGGSGYGSLGGGSAGIIGTNSDGSPISISNTPAGNLYSSGGSTSAQVPPPGPNAIEQKEPIPPDSNGDTDDSPNGGVPRGGSKIAGSGGIKNAKKNNNGIGNVSEASTTEESIKEMNTIRKSCDWDLLAELKRKNSKIKNKTDSILKKLSWSSSKTDSNPKKIKDNIAKLNTDEKKVKKVIDKTKNQCEQRLKNTQKLKDKYNDDLDKAKGQEGFNLNYDNPISNLPKLGNNGGNSSTGKSGGKNNKGSLFTKKFYQLDVKCSAKSDYQIHSSGVKGRSKAVGMTSNIYSTKQVSASMFMIKGKSYYDFEASIDILLKSQGKAGVAFRVVDNYNYYALIIDKNQNYKAIIKVINGTKKELKRENDGGLLLDTWYTIKIRCQASNIKITISTSENSLSTPKKILETLDYSFSVGSIGTFVNGMNGFFFDKFYVQSLPCWTPWDPKTDIKVTIPNANIYDENFKGNLEDKFVKNEPDDPSDEPSQWVMKEKLGQEFLGGIEQQSQVYDKSINKRPSMITSKDKTLTNGSMNVCFTAYNNVGSISIIFKYQNEINSTKQSIEKFYNFEMQSSGETSFEGSFTLKAHLNGFVKVLAIKNNKIDDLPFLGYVINKNICVNIETINSHITIKVSLYDYDFIEVFNIDDDSIKTGTIGFGTLKTKAKFVSLSLRPPEIQLTDGDKEYILNNDSNDLPFPSISSIQQKLKETENNAENELSTAIAKSGSSLGIDINDAEKQSANTFDKKDYVSTNFSFGWTECVATKTNLDRNNFCKRNFNNEIQIETCKHSFCDSCCNKKAKIHKNILYSCKKTCYRSQNSDNSNTDYNDVCINSQNPMQNVYSYCDENINNDKKRVISCKLDLCNLCCATLDGIKQKNYSFNNEQNCFKKCSESNIKFIYLEFSINDTNSEESC